MLDWQCDLETKPKSDCMANITFYPIGNADCCLIKTDAGNKFVFDFADTKNREDKTDKRIDLREAIRNDTDWPKVKQIDVLAITHGDDDHLRKVCDTFYLESRSESQTEDHIKFKELWVPSNLLTEVGCEDHTKIIRKEARHRFKEGKGIRVFSRPDSLREWCRDNDIDFDTHEHLITDAGQLTPGWTLANHGIEFFVHSPFAHRQDDGLEDRNGNCLVMQAVIRSGGRDTKFLITADSISENWQEIVEITKEHGNEERLEWDVFSVPHHCSYLSMSDEIGDVETEPTEEFEWLLEQGRDRGVIVVTSKIIPKKSESLPPHVETYQTYKKTAKEINGQIYVTMEWPTEANPGRLKIDISGSGVVPPQRTSASVVTSVVSTPAPRNG
jgi:beta-lactamase superfamily II metal-dependent hydrolase